MKLLDVKVVLDRDKGILQAKHKAQVMKEHDDTTTRYAILSHRWGAEVDYKEMIGLMKMVEEGREDVKQRHGYQKIIESCKQAMKDGYHLLWVDTCCIDKRSSAELSEAINSMYRWYQNAQMCYAYLNDIDEPTFPTEPDKSKFDKSNGWPEWFVRGWTLQELIAPKQVKFFNKDWVPIGNKRRLAPTLEYITDIPRGVLTSGLTGKRLSVAQIMSWAANRRTTRVEDRAYSLMGLFGVNMPMLYGEGKKAFRRLQLEIIRESSDHSIFAWHPRTPRTSSVLAEDPSNFWCCSDVEKVEPNEFVDRLRQQSRCSDSERIAAFHDAVHSQQFLTFTVSNAGIQVLLPVIPSHDSPSLLRAILACTRQGALVTVDLVSSGRSFARTSIYSLLPGTHPEFKTLHLIHYQDTNETRRESALDERCASFHGFTRRCTYPRELTGNTVTHSFLAEDLIVVVYANDDARSCFAIGLGHYLGQGWVHVVDGGRSPTKEENWTVIGRKAYRRMWRARAKHARLVANYHNLSRKTYFIQHVHLTRSIQAVRLVWNIREAGDLEVMVDVTECPGCCGGPCTGTTEYGLMKTAPYLYQLQLDNQLAFADECFGQRIALGDYGDYSRGNFVRTGNIFEDMRAAGIGLSGSDCSMVSSVSSSTFGRGIDRRIDQDDAIVAYGGTSKKCLALHQPKAFSLPANEQILLLLTALSVHLAGKHLVKTVIRCSDFYTFDEDHKPNDSSNGLAPDIGNHSAEAGNLTPLCIIACPRYWSIEPFCEERKEQFKSIRENFCALADRDQPMGAEPSHNSANEQKKFIAIKFFSNLFGLKYLMNYIGHITFFARFPLMTETSSVSDVPSVGPTKEDGYRGDQQFTAAESDPRFEAVLHLLHGRWKTLHQMSFMSPLCYTDERREVEGEINSISQTLGVALLEHIVVTGRNASFGHGWSKPIGQVRCFNIPSLVQGIKVLQMKLDATKDENEQRALEEDTTGKILWLFLCGICIEVDELLLKVLKYIERGTILGSLAAISMTIDHSTDLGDEQAPLRRIMLDAGANTSKYQLWLDAQAANQVLPPTLQRNLKQKLAELLDADASSEDEEIIWKPKIRKACT